MQQLICPFFLMRNLKAKSRFVVVIIKNVCRQIYGQTLKTSKMPKTKATLIIPDNAGVCVYLSCTPLPPPICRAHATDCSLSLVNSSEKLHSEPRNNTELVWKIKKKTRKKNSQKAAGCLWSGSSRWNRSNFARLICRRDPGLTM